MGHAPGRGNPTKPASQKIITKLRERRQIEADLRQMLSVRSESELLSKAQGIASQGSQVIPAIVGNLDQADARMLAAMGMVASYLDPDQVIAALRQAVIAPQRTDRGRIGAMTILEQYLGQSPDDMLLASLQDPEEAAVSSLGQVLGQAAGNADVLVQYIEELDQQEPKVLLSMIGSLQEMAASLPDGEQITTLLRMMAQDVRQEIAVQALQALGELRSTESAQALQGLVPIVSPALRPKAERAVRKLRFRGVRVEPLPPPDPSWRALIGPVSGRGQQSLWFILGERGRPRARFLNILLSDRAGAVEALGHQHVPLHMFPEQRPVGYLHDIALPDGSGAMLMLEAPFDEGRRLVVEALASNRETQIPVAGSLRLLSPCLWEYSGADSLAPGTLPELPVNVDALVADSARLLGHPAFMTWSVRSPGTWQAAEEALRHPSWDQSVWVRRLTAELSSEPEIIQVLSKRLESMSQWLMLAGDEEHARISWATAQALRDRPSQEQPFLQAVIGRDLEWALQTLEQNSDRA
jgi:hypothetical protein